MIARCWVLLIGCICCVTAYSQNAVVLLKFEDAEKAFNDGDYKQTLELLAEVEKEAGVTSRTLYLRIVTENKLFNNGQSLFDNIVEYDRLDRLRTMSKQYLNALSDQGIDDKYREVYRISENLSEMPKSMADWKTGRDAHEKALVEARLEEEKRLKAEAIRNKQLESTD